MKWKIKNKIFFLLGSIPCGNNIYYALQKYITKNVWLNDKIFKRNYDNKVVKHLDLIKKYGSCPIENASFFEFGAGWNMFAPIGFSLNNAKKYVTVDLNSYAHPELVRNTVEFYKKSNDINAEFKSKLDVFLETKINSTDDLRKFLKSIFQIEYYAPMDAGHTNFEPGSFDYVVSNVTLEHIPYKDINRIFKECNRLLKNNGLVSVTVDYTDHYAHADSAISVLNYLQYSDEEWKKYNPPLHFQNRLKRSDYENLLKNNGFEIVSVYSGLSAEAELLQRLEINDKFKKYPIEELLAKHDHFLARKISV